MSKDLSYGLGIIHDLGVGTSFNIKSMFPDLYMWATEDNFILCAESAGYVETNSQPGYSVDAHGIANGFTLTKSYDPSTGILTIGGASQGVYLRANWGGYDAVQYINVRVYFIE